MCLNKNRYHLWYKIINKMRNSIPSLSSCLKLSLRHFGDELSIYIRLIVKSNLSHSVGSQRCLEMVTNHLMNHHHQIHHHPSHLMTTMKMSRKKINLINLNNHYMSYDYLSSNYHYFVNLGHLNSLR